MTLPGRHIALAVQSSPLEQTGIDFIAVDPTDHALVSVFFVIDPSHADLALTAADFGIECRGARSGREVLPLTQILTTHTDAAGNSREVLFITFESGASFETQILTLTDLAGQRLDPYSSSTTFSFKQGCPSVFDCACTPEKAAATGLDYPVDYLARDFGSFMQAFIAYANDRYPGWEINLAADQAVMLGEVMAALGDEFAYIQDRYSLETQFDKLKERRSFEQLTRILGYRLRPELPATGFAVLRHYKGTEQPGFPPGPLVLVTAGTPLKGFGDADEIIPFEVGASLADILARTEYPTHSQWTDIPAHVPDETCPYIKKGGTYVDVVGTALDDSAIGPGTKILIETRPIAQDDDLYRRIVTLTEAPAVIRDELLNIDVTRLTFGAEDALDFNLPLEITFVSANLVPVISGRTHTARFTIGAIDPNLPRAIEREGAAADLCALRPVIYRFPLAETVLGGLSWRVENGSTPWDIRYEPEVALTRTNAEGVPSDDWRITRDMLSQTATDEAATIEAGHWGPVFSWLDNNQPRQHIDYIGDPGHCLRFGDGVFGALPPEGAFFTVTYRTALAICANLPAERLDLQAIVPPDTRPAMPAGILSVWNPLPFTNAQTPENIELAKFTVPHFHKGRKLRAVRNEDFHTLLSARDDIQSALANARWTGCWTSTFVATDPIETIEPNEVFKAEINAYLEELRLVGRPAYLADAALRPLDLQIAICPAPQIPFGTIVQAIRDALVTGPKAFFDPDRLSFGSAIYRADLEACVAAQPGVRSILEIRYRWRGERIFSAFTESVLTSAPDQIPILKHDPTRPDLGQLQLFDTIIPPQASA